MALLVSKYSTGWKTGALPFPKDPCQIAHGRELKSLFPQREESVRPLNHLGPQYLFQVPQSPGVGAGIEGGHAVGRNLHRIVAVAGI